MYKGNNSKMQKKDLKGFDPDLFLLYMRIVETLSFPNSMYTYNTSLKLRFKSHSLTFYCWMSYKIVMTKISIFPTKSWKNQNDTWIKFPDYSNSNQRCFVRADIRGRGAQHALHRPLAGVHQHGRDQSLRGNAPVVRKRVRATWTRTDAGEKTILSRRRSLLHPVPDADGRAVRVRSCKIRTFNSAGFSSTKSFLLQLFQKARPV